MSFNNLNVLDFQMYLLKTMLPPQNLLLPALDKLGCTVEDMHTKFEAVDRSTKLVQALQGNFRFILEEVLVGRVDAPDGETFEYQIPLWPQFLFHMSFDPSGEYVTRAEFVRCEEYSSEEGVNPWNFLEMDIVNAFENINDLDEWGHYQTYRAQGRNGGDLNYLRFAWGLLQEIELVES